MIHFIWSEATEVCRVPFEALDLLSGQLGYFSFLFLLQFLYKTVQNRNLKLYVLGHLQTKGVEK